MNEEIKKKKSSLEISNKHFEKLLTVCLLFGIIVVGAFVIYYILTPEEGFVMFGYLHQDPSSGEWEAENYQTNATVGQEINFSIEVVNYIKRDFTFRVKILKGDNDTDNRLHSPSSNAVLNYTTNNITLSHGNTWNSGILNITFYEIGENHMIIMELWQIFDDSTEAYWDHIWMRLNITT